MKAKNFVMLGDDELVITNGGTVITPTPSPEEMQKVGEAIVEGVVALVKACSK